MKLDIELDESSGPRGPRFSYKVDVKIAKGRLAVSETGARKRDFERPLSKAEEARISSLLDDYTEWKTAGDLTGGEPRRTGVSYNHLVIRDAGGEHRISYLVTHKADHPWLDALVTALRSLPETA